MNFSYYHLVIRHKPIAANQWEDTTVFDLYSKDELMNKYLIPILAEDFLLVGGGQVATNTISKIYVYGSFKSVIELKRNLSSNGIQVKGWERLFKQTASREITDMLFTNSMLNEIGLDRRANDFKNVKLSQENLVSKNVDKLKLDIKKEKWRDMLAKGKTKALIDEILTFSRDRGYNELRKYVLHLSAQMNFHFSNYSKRTVSGADYDIFINKQIDNLIVLIENIEDYIE